MQKIRFVELTAQHSVPLGLATLALLLAAGQPATAGGPDANALHRALHDRLRAERAASSAPSALERATDAKSAALAEFQERIKPYLSSGGYYGLFRGAKVAPEGAVPFGLPQAAAPESPDVQVNDRDTEGCFVRGLVNGCMQSETSIAVAGTNVVIGFNDSRGFFDGTHDVSGYAYSTDGGMTWTDGGALPLAGRGDRLRGDPALVFCNGSFYYASLSQTGCGAASGMQVSETEPNDAAILANRVSLGDDYAGDISSASDVDYVAFSAPKGTALEATTELGTLSDSTLQLFDADRMTPLAFNDDFGGSKASRIFFIIPADGTYYLAVRGRGDEGSYTLRVRSCDGSIPPSLSAVSVSRGSVIGPALVWEAPVVAAVAPEQVDNEPEGVLDKDYIACDPSTGALYVTYTHSVSVRSTGQVELVRSTDGGSNWSLPTVVDPEGGGLKQGAVPAVGPGGEVYVVWLQGAFRTSPSGKATIQLRKSMDGGQTFPMHTQVAEFVETTFNPPVGYNRDQIFDFPSIAVDRRAGPKGGNIYITFEEADRDVRDIKLARSTNGGEDFGPAIRVNDDPPGADQFFPWVAVDPTDGQVSVISYDRRRSPGSGLTDVFLSQSNDGGLTFVPGVAVNDFPSSFFVATDAHPNFGDYINVTADGAAIYATWADGRNGDPDVFFRRIAKIVAPSVLLQSFSVDDRAPRGDGDGVPEPGEHPRLKVTLANVGSAPATGVSATLRANNPRVTVTQNASGYGDLGQPGSLATARSLYQFSVDPSLVCSQTVVCPAITTQLYGVDLGGTIVRFAFDTGTSESVLAPGDTPSRFNNGLAVKSPTDAFWVNGVGKKMIFEFNPQTGELSPGPFPVPAPGEGCTDGLGLVSPNRLFAQNSCEGKLYEVDANTGRVTNDSLPGGLGLAGGLAGGNGRLFATLRFRVIAELDPDSGGVLHAFEVPDLSGDGRPDQVLGLAFDGTYLFAASFDAVPPNVMALDPANGQLLGVSPFNAPSGDLSALDAVAGPPGEVCKAGTFRTMIDFGLDITTDQRTFSSALSVPLGREAKTTAFRDDVETGVNGWTATGEWHQTTDRSAGRGHSWYFGRENGPQLGDNAYDDNAAGDITSPPIDLSGASSAELVFDHYLARELCCDIATVSASADGFATSTLLRSLDPALDPAFTEVRIDLSAFAGKPAVQVRFTFTSDASVTFEGWYVDNIRVEQTTLDCQASTPGSTTTTSSTTTTTRPTACRTDADCDEGNPCTTDQCTGGACVHLGAQGFVGADCELGAALTGPLCQVEQIDRRLKRFIDSKVKMARALVAKAQRTDKPRRADSIIERADRNLATISGRTRKAQKARRISDACARMIDDRINDLRGGILALRT